VRAIGPTRLTGYGPREFRAWSGEDHPTLPVVEEHAPA